jgi:hypothetical protein
MESQPHLRVKARANEPMNGLMWLEIPFVKSGLERDGSNKKSPASPGLFFMD